MDRNKMGLAPARKLVSDIEALAFEFEAYPERCEAVEKYAKGIEAHAMARVVCWLRSVNVMDRYGHSAMHGYAGRRANDWLAGLEREALEEWNG